MQRCPGEISNVLRIGCLPFRLGSPSKSNERTTTNVQVAEKQAPTQLAHALTRTQVAQEHTQVPVPQEVEEVIGAPTPLPQGSVQRMVGEQVAPALQANEEY